jgi:hypothetical protein
MTAAGEKYCGFPHHACYVRWNRRRIPAQQSGHLRVGEAYIFNLPEMPFNLRIVSCAASTAELGLARGPRVFGVALRRIVVRKNARFRIADALDQRLTTGFHTFESDNRFRWTNGDAAIAIRLHPADRIDFVRCRHDALGLGWPRSVGCLNVTPGDVVIMVAAAPDGVCVVTATRAG